MGNNPKNSNKNKLTNASEYAPIEIIRPGRQITPPPEQPQGNVIRTQNTRTDEERNEEMNAVRVEIMDLQRRSDESYQRYFATVEQVRNLQEKVGSGMGTQEDQEELDNLRKRMERQESEYLERQRQLSNKMQELSDMENGMYYGDNSEWTTEEQRIPIRRLDLL